MKKGFIAAIIMIALISPLPPTLADSKTIDSLEYAPFEYLGQPIESTTINHGTVSMEDGKPIACMAISGDTDETGRFQVVDLTTGELLRSFDVVGQSFYAHTTDSNYNVYFAGYRASTLYKYSPVDKTLTNLGATGQTATCQIVVDEQDNVYLGTYGYNGARIFKYSSAGVRDAAWGGIKYMSGSDYCSALAYYDGYLYCGGSNYNDGNAEIYKISTSDPGSKVAITPPAALQGKIVSYSRARAVRDKIFFYISTKDTPGYSLAYIVYDCSEGEFTDDIFQTNQGSFPTDEYNGYVYMTKSYGSYKYNLEDGTYTNVNTSGYTIRGGNFVTFDERPGFLPPGRYPNNTAYVNFGFSGDITLVDYLSDVNDRYSYPNNLKPMGNTLVGVLESDGYVYVSAHQGTFAPKYDPETQTSVLNISPFGQSTPIVKIEGKIYYGAYPSASLSVYDPSQPISDGINPRELGNVKADGQSRPMTIANAGGKIVMGCIADYGLLQGGFGIYDPISNSMKFVSAPKDLGVTGLAYKDGFLYGSTTIKGGLDSVSTKSYAMLFKYDMTNETMVWEKEINLGEGYAKPQKFGGLVFGDDGLLWSASHGLIFALDPETALAVKSINVNNYNAASSVGWIPYTLAFDPDGFLYAAAAGKIFVVDTSTLEYKSISSGLSGIEQFSLSEDGKRIYTYNGGQLYRIRRFESVIPRLTGNHDLYVAVSKEAYTDKLGDSITDRFGVTFGQISPYSENFELIEYGMLLSTRHWTKELFTLNNVSARPFTAKIDTNAEGQYGILFYGLSKGVTYYTRAYMKYINIYTLKETTLYSDIINTFSI